MLFDVDTQELNKLKRFAKGAPRQFSRAAAGVLNSLAFDTRTNSMKTLDSALTIRNENFLKSSLRVDMARVGTPIDSLKSEVGSIRRDRFTGWEENETGQASPKNRVATLAARGGSWESKIAPSVRLKKPMRSSADYPGANEETRVAAMLREIKEQMPTQPFIVRRKVKRLAPGVYKFKRKKLLRMQTFGKPETPQKIGWMSKSRKKTIKSFDIRRAWAKQIDRIVR